MVLALQKEEPGQTKLSLNERGINPKDLVFQPLPCNSRTWYMAILV